MSRDSAPDHRPTPPKEPLGCVGVMLGWALAIVAICLLVYLVWR